MIQQYHILNGDVLKDRFPQSIEGQLIVIRECLVDGPVNNDSLEAFYKTRSHFLNIHYEDTSIKDYYAKVVSEFNKIKSIPNDSEINLWFEDDLFCQVNLWFIIYLLSISKCKASVFLVRPKNHTQYGFGGLSGSELIEIFNQKIQLKPINKLSNLWHLYKDGKHDLLLEYIGNLNSIYAFMIPAIKANIERIPSTDNLGRPKEALLKISKTLNTKSFPEIFNAFCEQQPIYGLGDLQVKRLWNELNDKI